MEKINLCDATGFEVYCTRNDFNYDCNDTPNNCTECPIMRFHCHDLIYNLLTEESAAVLAERVKSTGIFSGKYNGANQLPSEIWSLIYDMRMTYFHALRQGNSVEFRYECINRFCAWLLDSKNLKDLAVSAEQIWE